MFSVEFYKNNRKRLIDTMVPNSFYFVHSGEDVESSDDANYLFEPYRNFVYMTGLNCPGAMYMAIKYPNKVREILFMHIPDEREQRWIGTKFDKEAIQKSTGIDEVMDITVWEALVSRMMFKDNIQDVYVDIARWLMDYPANREQQIANHLKTVYPYLNIHNAYQTVCKMRTIKSKEEIEAHRKAVAITEEGVKFMMKNMKPGMTECQMEAYYDFILRATMLRHQHLQLLQQQVRTHV